MVQRRSHERQGLRPSRVSVREAQRGRGVVQTVWGKKTHRNGDSVEDCSSYMMHRYV